MSIISYSYVPDQGWTGTGFCVPAEKKPEKAELSISAKDGSATAVRIKELDYKDGNAEIKTEDFDYRSRWTLSVDGALYTRKDMTAESCEGVDAFDIKKDGNVIYRLYTPKVQGPRPLILFLHGGGNGGDDLITHIAADYGCTQFPQKYPDFYVMAPQAPERDMKEFLKNFGKADFAHSDQTGPYGWYREYLAEICALIRSMIKEGKVDGRRVYVTGMSMGGAGSLRALSVGAGLFAAAVPICPSMTPETFNILKGLTKAKLWIATAYVDHTIYRHKYIVDGIMALKEAGNKDAHLTLYSPEELAKYGIATEEDLSLKDRFWKNHWSWVPTYHDEHGIMSWMTEQILDI